MTDYVKSLEVRNEELMEKCRILEYRNKASNIIQITFYKSISNDREFWFNKLLPAHHRRKPYFYKGIHKIVPRFRKDAIKETIKTTLLNIPHIHAIDIKFCKYVLDENHSFEMSPYTKESYIPKNNIENIWSLYFENKYDDKWKLREYFIRGRRITNNSKEFFKWDEI